MNEFNVPPEPNRSSAARKRAGGGGAGRRAASNPGVEPTAPAPRAGQRASQAEAARPVSNRERRPTTTTTRNKENAMECSTKTRTGLSLLGGAGLGAVLMYLLDPEQGPQRRAQIGEKAASATETTAAALAAALEVAKEKGQSAADVLSEKLGEYGSAGAETASSLGSSASGLTSRLFDRASDTGHRLGRTSRRYAESARENIGSPRSWFGHEEHRSYVPSTGTALSAVACLAAGFGLMYMLDPQQGRRRRAVARDKTMKWLREIGDMSRKTGRHLANKGKGYAHESAKAARGMVGEGSTLGSLADRVRSRIGALGRGRNVNVDCDDFGRVALSGECEADEVAILITEIETIPGVESIDNRMNVRDGTGAGLGQ